MKPWVDLDGWLYGSDIIRHWEMTDSERLTFLSLLKRLKPKFGMEIGSRNGGTLQFLARTCEKVYCLDIDESLPARMSDQFPNAEYFIGDTKKTLPKVLSELEQRDALPEFILIDGDHTVEGARYDIETILRVKPKSETLVLVHDTFNPDVREGLKMVNFDSCEYLQYGDIDFVSGIYHTRKPVENEMWGGISLFWLGPEKRDGKLNLLNYLEPQFKFVHHECLKLENA